MASREVTMAAVRAVVFDIGGVLEHHGDSSFAGRWERRLGLAPGELFGRIRRSGLGRDGNLGKVSEAEFGRALGALFGLDQRRTGELLDDLWDWYAGPLNAEVADYFRSLRPRWRTAILSNAAAGGVRREEERYRFSAMADVLVYSFQEGIQKPDHRIYLRTCERLGVPPDAALFLDDVEENVAGAREAGMRAVQFRDTAQAIADVEACLRDGA
jgi:epoxide hydrolase-like predicted phosphatase